MNNKQQAFAGVWNKYLPAIRILVKKTAITEQVLGMNRADFERAAGIRKAGYRFSVSFINGRADALFNGNDIVQAFIGVLQDDVVTHALLAENDYTFSFSTKYQMLMKNNSLPKQALLAETEEAISAN